MPYGDQIDASLEKAIDYAIDWFMASKGWQRFDDGNYHNVNGGDIVIGAPGKPRSAGGMVTHDDGTPALAAFGFGDGSNTGSVENAGSLVYAHFENAIRDLFTPWYSIPDPAAFTTNTDYLADAAYKISLTSSGNKVDEIGNADLSAVTFLRDKITGDDMGGNSILLFDQNFVTPLPTVIHGQYAVTLLVGLTLVGEQKIWEKARSDVLSIADKVQAAMKARGPVDAINLSTLSALVSLAGVFPGPQKAILGTVGSVLSPLQTLLDATVPPSKPDTPFASGDPDGVVQKGKDALKHLSDTIRGKESEIEGKIKDAMRTVTGERAGSFDMPTPTLLSETQVNEMKVNLDTLRFLATETLPKIARQTGAASDKIAFGAGPGSYCSSAWIRPMEIGVSDSMYGPYDTWAELGVLAQELTENLTWEIQQSGAHLETCADRDRETEAQVEASLRRQAEKLRDGSGYRPISDVKKWLHDHP